MYLRRALPSGGHLAAQSCKKRNINIHNSCFLKKATGPARRLHRASGAPHRNTAEHSDDTATPDAARGCAAPRRGELGAQVAPASACS